MADTSMNKETKREDALPQNFLQNSYNSNEVSKEFSSTPPAAEPSLGIAATTRSPTPPFSASSSITSSSRDSSFSSENEEEDDHHQRQRSRSYSSSSSTSSSSFSSSSSSSFNDNSPSSAPKPQPQNKSISSAAHSKEAGHKRKREDPSDSLSSFSDPPSIATENKALPSSSSASSSVNRNPHLQFEKSDSEYIPLPVIRTKMQMAQVLRSVVEDTQTYPWKTYRMLDYFRTAVQMFIAEVRQEYRLQNQGSLRNGKPLTRFTWKNKGELAICFACLCDMLKLLYDKVRPGPLKPLWDDFVEQLAPLLMHGSRIPAAVLSANTYHTKFMDWQKGGTRYGGESSRSNVRFPSAAERQVKVETFLRSGVGYNIKAVVVDPSMAGGQMYPVSKPRPTAVPTPSLSSASSSSSPLGSYSNFSSLPPGVGGGMTSFMHSFPLRPGGKVAVKAAAGPGQAGVAGTNLVPPAPPRQIPEEMRHLFWLAALARIKGGDLSASFPDHRAPLMIAFGKLCEMSKTREEKLVLVSIIRGSSHGIHHIMERLGGLVSFRQFAASFIAESDSEGLMLLVNTVARLRLSCWSRISQEVWCTDLRQKRGFDLQWLRQLPMIPTNKRAAWGALLLMLEEKFIFTLPLEALDARRQQLQAQETSAGMLRSPSSVSLANRTLSSTMGSLEAIGLQAATADNRIPMRNWKWPRLHTFYARRLPDDWRAPVFLNEDDESAVNSFLEKRQAFFEEEQEKWKNEILERIANVQGSGNSFSFSPLSKSSSFSGCSSPNDDEDHPVPNEFGSSGESLQHGESSPSFPVPSVPLWYDPFALLGVVPPSKIEKMEALEEEAG